METSQSSPVQNRHGEKENALIVGEGPITEQDPGFMFGRMFPVQSAPPMILKLDACREVGSKMTSKLEENRPDSRLPAGYTYFGQFVDHDISHDGSAGDDSASPLPDADLVQVRSPSLDLDSLYGGAGRRDDQLFNGPRFKIGQTVSSRGAGHSNLGHLPFDLPRKMESRSDKTARTALIGDARNDENLAVAQTHLMWLKFHNEIVNQLSGDDLGASEGMIFEEARSLVTKHYQHIVLHDFVKRFIDPTIYNDVVVRGKRQVLTQSVGEVAFMPLEFSVAAYRHGHSQVRQNYNWNAEFEGASFRLLFEFSAVSGNFFGVGESLPSNWIANYRRLFDFGDTEFPHQPEAVEVDPATGKQKLNFARAIDPYLAQELASLPEIEALVNMDPPLRPFANLAALNLRRGSMRSLPSGQDVSRQLRSVKMLTPKQMRDVIDEEFDLVMNKNGFYERTPLWLYVLLEASAVGSGEFLGPVGSTIVADTFRTLVLTSRSSILTPGAEWEPSMAMERLGAMNPLETIADILLWIDERTPIINPLEDDRTPGLVAVG